MKTEIIDTINIFGVWSVYEYSNPEELNEQESLFVQVKNHAYERDWSLPRVIEGWLFAEAWFDNMISGQKGRRGATRLQYRSDMGTPIFLAGHDNSNNGANLWFVPQVSVGGDYPYSIRAEIQYTKRGLAEFARLYAE